MKRQKQETGASLDDRADAYRTSGDMLAAIARHHHGIAMDDTTKERWRQLMGLMREVDTWADDTGASHDEVIGGLANFDQFRERYPELAPDALEADARESLLKRARHILKVGEMASRQLQPCRFMALRIIEARETVNMLGDVATPLVAEQPGFKEALMPTLRALGEAATLWDSLIDGRQDVRSGKQVLKPTAEYYARLTGAMLKRAKLGAGALLHVEPNKYLIVKAGQRVANRLKNGVPDYSTLARFKSHRRRKPSN